MRLYLIITLSIFVISLLLSCSESNKHDGKSEKNGESINIQTDTSAPDEKVVKKKSDAPIVVKQEKLSESYTKVVEDYYDDGKKFEVNYYDYEVSESPLFHKKYYRNGQVFMEGELLEGVRQGKWISWYENGRVWSTAEYKNGKNHGSNNVYYDNGQLRYNKEYDMGTPNGLWKFYCPEGNLLGEVMYNQGEIEWEKDYMN